jgi:AraC family transcriptional regulator, transcriptional activator FtrA
MKDHLVVALAYDQLCTFEFGCVVEIFALKRPELGVDWYKFAVCAAERGPIRAAGGISVTAAHSLAILDRADTIIIPGWRDADDPPPEALLKKLRAAYKRGARICTICSGVFVLAAAGLLSGKKVTTHWRYSQKLADRFPEVEVLPNALYVEAEHIVTSAGSAAGLDMMLHLIRNDHGTKVANLVAQRLVMPPHRLGDQAQFVPRPMPVDEAARLSKLMDWIRANPKKVHSLRSLADRAAMSTRTLQRQFQEATGMSPIDWLTLERVGVAKDLLASSRKSVTQICESSGFASQETFRRHFRLIVGVSPTAYRKQFGGA